MKSTTPSLAVMRKACRTKDWESRRGSFKTSRSVRFWSHSVTGTTWTSSPSVEASALSARLATAAAARPWFWAAANDLVQISLF